jgi:hypothetical protein
VLSAFTELQNFFQIAICTEALDLKGRTCRIALVETWVEVHRILRFSSSSLPSSHFPIPIASTFKSQVQKTPVLPGMVVQACSPSTQEAEARGS